MVERHELKPMMPWSTGAKSRSLRQVPRAPSVWLCVVHAHQTRVINIKHAQRTRIATHQSQNVHCAMCVQ